MAEGINILKRFTKQWQLFLAIETVLYALGSALLIFFLTSSYTAALIAFLIAWIIAALIIQPWKPTIDDSCFFLNSQLEELEYSTTLLLHPNHELKGLAKLQQYKVYDIIKKHVATIRPPHHLKRSLLIGIGMTLIGFALSQFTTLTTTSNQNAAPTEDSISFQPLDSIETAIEIPEIISQKINISYPKYTKLGNRSSTQMSLKALEGSLVTWQLQFSTVVDSVFMESLGQLYPMTLNDDNYVRSNKLEKSGIYNFRFKDVHGNSYTSELYTIEVFKDEAPEIELQNLKQFNSFTYDQDKTIDLNCIITDDYGIGDAYIIATVSKGSGESVKFREEKLEFSNLISGSKLLNLTKQLNLDALQMTPGDELYFYVEAVDQKQPKLNRARSETYFAVIQDTTSYEFSLEGTLGVDRMPDYFRSQRQLIIDTEKLISERNALSEYDFKFKSNELGYDQKALRMKYAEFMGEETESGIVIEEDIESLDGEDDHDHDEDEEDDPLAEYTHDHDNENEHNLVDEEAQKKNKGQELLEAYQHNHEDPEAATLYKESLKTKLRKALNEMWDSELHLRLYDPEKSLPYQNRALKLIQDIKNHARIYVHRIGFDPPPIKEDKRLSGDLDDIVNYSKNKTFDPENDFRFTQQSIARLVVLINTGQPIKEDDRLLFEDTGNEIAAFAIESPVKYLETLQNLKQLTTIDDHSKPLLLQTLQGLLNAVPRQNANPIKEINFIDPLGQLLLKELTNED